MIPFAWCKILCAKTKLECVNDVTSIVSFFFFTFVTSALSICHLPMIV